MAVETKIVLPDRATTPATPGASEKCRRVFRTCGALPLAALFIASWYLPRREDILTRYLIAFAPIAVLMFGAELAAEPNRKLTRSGRWRIGRTRAGGMALLRQLAGVVLHGLITVVGFVVLLRAHHPGSVTMGVIRLAAGTTLLYAAASFIFGSCGLGALLLGYSLPSMHRTPLFARSLSEFWARRWNIAVSAWLHNFVFRPLAGRGYARAGIAGCFVVSGLFHAWPMLAALGTTAALSTMAFFLIQGALVLVEKRLRVHTWPVALARVWTLTILLASSPLIIDPGLRVFGL
jgi:hypothetical protein